MGFRCSECGSVVQAMFGDTCNSCLAVERRHKEMVQAIKGRNNGLEESTQEVG